MPFDRLRAHTHKPFDRLRAHTHKPFDRLRAHTHKPFDRLRARGQWNWAVSVEPARAVVELWGLRIVATLSK